MDGESKGILQKQTALLFKNPGPSEESRSLRIYAREATEEKGFPLPAADYFKSFTLKVILKLIFPPTLPMAES